MKPEKVADRAASSVGREVLIVMGDRRTYRGVVTKLDVQGNGVDEPFSGQVTVELQP